MSKVEGRDLWRAHCRCPRCGRILKVRLRRTQKPRIYMRSNMSDEEMYNFSVAEIPPHKHYQRDPKRLTKVVIDGKAPEEHPWCHFASTSVIMGINKSGIPDYQKGWEFIKWR